MTPESISAARAPLHVDAVGDVTQPTLVLLHGYGDGSTCWPTQVDRWSPSWYVVLPDARGHGTSPRWTQSELDEGVARVMVDDVIVLLEALAAETGQPQAVLVGHSMGAAVAGEVAAARPDLVRGLVLEDPPWFTDFAERMAPDQAKADARAAGVRSLAAMTHEERVALARRQDPGWTDAEYEGWAACKGDGDLALASDPRASAFQDLPWPDVVSSLESHRVPTLLVGGTREDALVTPEVAALAEETGGGLVETELLEGAGHNVRRDRRAEYHAVVDPFLESLRP